MRRICKEFFSYFLTYLVVEGERYLKNDRFCEENWVQTKRSKVKVTARSYMVKKALWKAISLLCPELASCIIYAEALPEYVIFILWVRSFS